MENEWVSNKMRDIIAPIHIFIRKKFIRNEAQMAKIFRKSYENHEARVPTLNAFVGQK